MTVTSQSSKQRSNAVQNVTNTGDTARVIAELEQENFNLRQYAEKVTKELARCQPSQTQAATDDVTLPPWATDMKLMSPLILAYEERIRELESVNQKSYGMAEQAQSLATENETLREELQHKTEQLAQLHVQGVAQSHDGFFGGRTRMDEEREEVEQLYKMSVEQNEVLAQQNVLLKSQIEKVQKAIQQTKQQADIETKKSQECVKLVQEMERKCHTADEQRGAAERKIQTLNRDLVQLTENFSRMEGNYETCRQELKANQKHMAQFKDTCQEKTSRLKDENLEYHNENERFEIELKEKRTRCQNLERENTDLSEKLRIARREAEAAKLEAQNMIQLMEQLERKEKQIRIQFNETKAKLEVTDKDLADIFLEKSKFDALEDAQQEMQERFEKKMKDDIADLLEEVTAATEGQKQVLEKRIDELEEGNSRADALNLDLQSKHDLLTKQRQHDLEAAESRLQLARQEKQTLESDLEEAQSIRLRQEQELDQAKEQLRRLRAELSDTTTKTCAEINAVSRESHSLQAAVEQHKRDLVEKDHELLTMQQQRDGLRSRVELLQKEVFDSKEHLGYQIEDDRKRHDAEKSALQQKLKQITSRSRQGEQRAIELLRVQEELRSKWQEELTSEKRDLEMQVEKLKKQCLQMRMGQVLAAAGSNNNNNNLVSASSLKM